MAVAGWATGLRTALAHEEVPFITTPDRVTLAMLELARVGPGDHLIDLGSGDGRIVITAALRHGASGLGVDIVPDLVRRSRESAERAGVAARARFEVQDLFETELQPATVITLYLLPEFNLRLRPRLLALRPGTRIVSHDWDMGDWAPDATVVVEVPEKAIGREKLSRVHLWEVPAPLEGVWCAGTACVWRLSQHFQRVQAVVEEGGPAYSATVRGTELRIDTAGGVLEARWSAPHQLTLLRVPAGRAWRDRHVGEVLTLQRP